jgi:hypothetical protein
MKLLLSLSFFLIPMIVLSQSASDQSVLTYHEIMVELKDGQSPDRLYTSLDQLRPRGISKVEKVTRRWNIHLFSFDPLIWEKKELTDWFNKQAIVKFAQPNDPVQFRTEPNDPEYFYQWSSELVGAPTAWSVTTNGLTALGDTIVVAVLDKDFDFNHEDLRPNLWSNPREIPDDGIDNDNNGYIDDTWGWNFITNSNQPDNTNNDHGLSVSGIIGAKGNNDIGIAGLNWNTKIISLYVTNFRQVAEAFEYIIDLREQYNATNGQEGAFVVAANTSFGINLAFCDEYATWGDMYDKMGEVGILSGAATANIIVNVDIEGDMPTSCSSDFILTVLNSTADDQKALITGYGKSSIDMAAPGTGTYSLKRFNRYGEFGGNSASAPHLTSAISLLYGIPCKEFAANALTKPMETALIVRQAILDGVDKIDAFEDITVTGGRLNIANAFQQMDVNCEDTTGELDIINISPNPAFDKINIRFQVPEIVPHQFNIFNSLGQIVYSSERIPSRFGEKIHTIDVSNWSEGTYFLVLQMDKDFVVEPVAIVRYR